MKLTFDIIGYFVAISLLGFTDSITEAVVCNDDPTLNCSDTQSIGCKVGDAQAFEKHRLPDGTLLPFHSIKTSENGYHCDCKDGYTGLNCFRSFKTCDVTDENPEGTNKCYNSGKCVPDVLDKYGNEQLFCDCMSAQLSKHDGYPNKTIGKYCTEPVVECGERPLNKHFCLNNGKCTKDVDYMCEECDAPFVGPHCEFSSQEAYEAKCTLNCKNGGVCIRGFKNVDQATIQYNQQGFFVEADYQHCKCKDGFGGFLCEHDKSPENQNSLCGDGECLNGGKCVSHPIGTDGLSKVGCDCSTAKNRTHSFTGRFCQHVSTDFCTRDTDQNGDTFCTNGGECSQEGTHFNCKCKKGFTGPMCEIAIGQGESAEELEECTLQCDNGGKCRTGTKDTSLLKPFGKEVEMFKDSHVALQHCVCPDGYVGVRCEFEVQVCGDNEHLCFHGSQCIVDENGNHSCDCDPGSVNGLTAVAGVYCENTATSHCTKSGQPGRGSDDLKNAFCVNDGQCQNILDDTLDPKGSGEDFAGCTCKAPYSGKNCELLVISVEATEEANEGQNGIKTGWKIVLSMVGILIVSLAIAGVFLLKKKQGMSKGEPSVAVTEPARVYDGPVEETTIPSPTNGSTNGFSNTEANDSPPVLNLGSNSIDGDDVENIEIL